MMAIAAMILPAAAISIAAALTAAVSTAWAEEIPVNKLYKDLADRNHYPAAEGLTQASADVKCNITEQLVAAFPDAAGKTVSVKYTWSRADANSAPVAKFAVTGVPESTPDLANRLNALFAYANPVLADPIWWEFGGFTMKASKEGEAITLSGAPPAQGVVKNLTVDVEGATLKVRKMTYDLGEAKLTVEFVSKDLGGKWGLEKKSIIRPSGSQIFTFEYVQADSFWVPSKLTFDQTKADGTASGEPQYVYEFSNWQVAKAAP
jgi:hypothetical protein